MSISKSAIYNKIRRKYSVKRLSFNWKKRKKTNLKERRNRILKEFELANRTIINLPAPSNFSFINNTIELLHYFEDVKQVIFDRKSAFIDISRITKLTPDTIILLIAKLHEKLSKKIGIRGNAPDDPKLNRMFIESGLYDYVRSRGYKKVSQINKLWKHTSNSIVKGEMAGVAINACKQKFLENGVYYDTDNLYNLLVEAMSNTLNHASNKSEKSSKQVNWWLYYYIDEFSQCIKFSFIDLGVGIFKSASFDSYRNLISYFSPSNKILIRPFLEGKIISSRKNDNEISGKGVKQMMSCANLDEFIKFIIITNDVIIDVKNKNGKELNTNFKGTFIYFEVSYKNQNGSKIQN
jgi:hypothetical protein